MTIVNDDYRVINKLQTQLTGDARVVIYDRHMFIVPATGRIPNGQIPSLSNSYFAKIIKFLGSPYGVLRGVLALSSNCSTPIEIPLAGKACWVK
jgi:hypothetical protein